MESKYSLKELIQYGVVTTMVVTLGNKTLDEYKSEIDYRENNWRGMKPAPKAVVGSAKGNSTGMINKISIEEQPTNVTLAFVQPGIDFGCAVQMGALLKTKMYERAAELSLRLVPAEVALALSVEPERLLSYFKHMRSVHLCMEPINCKVPHLAVKEALQTVYFHKTVRGPKIIWDTECHSNEEGATLECDDFYVFVLP